MNLRRFLILLFVAAFLSVSGQKPAKIGVPLAEVVKGIPDVYVKSVAMDRNGDVWIGTKSNGLVQLTPDGPVIFDKKNSPLLDNEINDIVVDSSGVKWIGMEKGGLARFDGVHWQVFSKANSGLPSNTIMRLLPDKDGLWIGTYFAGLVHYDGQKWHTFSTDNSPLLSNKVIALAKDHDDVLWVGTLGGGLCSLDSKGAWKVYTIYDSQLPSNFVYDIKVDPVNNKWIATAGKGIGVFNNEYWIVFNKENSNLNDDNIHAIYITNKGNKWVSTYRKGINFFNGRDWISYDHQNSNLPDDEITSIAYKYPNTLLFGMKRNGVIAFEDTLSVKHPGYADIFTKVGQPQISFGDMSQSGETRGTLVSVGTSNKDVSPPESVAVAAPDEVIAEKVKPKTNVPFEDASVNTLAFHLGSSMFRGDLDVRDQTALIGNFGFSYERNVLVREKYLGSIVANLDFGTLRGAKKNYYFRNSYREYKLLFKYITGNKRSKHNLLKRLRFYGSAGLGLLSFRSFMSDYNGVVVNKYGYKNVPGSLSELRKIRPEYCITVPLSVGVILPITSFSSLYYEIATSYLRNDKLDAKVARHFDKYILFDFGLSFDF